MSLTCPLPTPRLCYGKGLCNGKLLDKPKVSIHVTCDPREVWNETVSSVCLTTPFHPVNKAGASLRWHEAALRSTCLPESQWRMWQISLYFCCFSSFYITPLLPTQKPKRHTSYCLASTSDFAISPTNQAGRDGLVRLKICGRGFGGGVGSAFEDWGRQTRTDKLRSALWTFTLNLCSFSEENLLRRRTILVQKKINPPQITN